VAAAAVQVTPPALDPARQALLDDTRRLVEAFASRLEGSASRKARAKPSPTRASSSPFLPAGGGGRVQRGQERLHQRAPRRARPRGGSDADHLAVGILQHGSEVARRTRPDGIEETTAPAEALRALSIVDTPGTNAVLREHEALTRDFLPGPTSCSSSPRPTDPSPRANGPSSRRSGSGARKSCWCSTRPTSWRRRKTWRRSSRSCRNRPGRPSAPRPRSSPSPRGRRGARASGETLRAREKRPPRLRGEVTATLDERSAFASSSRTPWAWHAGPREATALVGQRLDVLQGDTAALEAIEDRVAGQAAEMTTTFASGSRTSRRRSSSSSDGQRLLRRAAAPRPLPGALRPRAAPARLRGGAVAGLPHEVERRVDGIVDWMVEAELRQWQT